MRSAIFYTVCACCLAIISCHSQHKATNTSASRFPVSPLTTTFTERLKLENPAQPSATFINDFNLLSIGIQYYVSGMAKVNAGFDEKNIQALNVHINTKAGNVATLQIPISNFGKFLQLKGIDYFEVSGKVNFK